MRLILANTQYLEEHLQKAAIRFQATGNVEAAFIEGRQSEDEVVTVGTNAVISVSGPLSYKYDLWAWLSDGSSYCGLQKKIRLAEQNENVSQIVMVYDTPGGEITGLQETADLIASVTKPIIAVVDPCCASAGLWLASQSDRIVSIPSGEIGSLGVQAVAMNYYEYFKKAGIDVSIFRANISPNKNLGHPYEEMTEEAREYIQSRVDEAGDRFVSTVAKGRNVSEAKVLSEFGQGKMLLAKDAKSVGLIDDIASLQEVLFDKKEATRSTAKRAKTLRRPVS